MAPTELLAEQHCAFARALVRAARHRGHAASRARSARAARRSALNAVAAGPRAWSSARTRCSRKALQFRDLALVIIDEQHRFGVQQRLALREKGAAGAASRTS